MGDDKTNEKKFDEGYPECLIGPAFLLWVSSIAIFVFVRNVYLMHLPLVYGNSGLVIIFAVPVPIIVAFILLGRKALRVYEMPEGKKRKRRERIMAIRKIVAMCVYVVGIFFLVALVRREITHQYGTADEPSSLFRMFSYGLMLIPPFVHPLCVNGLVEVFRRILKKKTIP